MDDIVKVEALKDLNNKSFGQIFAGKEIPKRVYSKIDILEYEKAGLIKITRAKKESKK